MLCFPSSAHGYRQIQTPPVSSASPSLSTDACYQRGGSAVHLKCFCPRIDSLRALGKPASIVRVFTSSVRYKPVACECLRAGSTLREPQSQFEDNPLKFRVVCPLNGTARSGRCVFRPKAAVWVRRNAPRMRSFSKKQVHPCRNIRHSRA